MNKIIFSFSAFLILGLGACKTKTAKDDQTVVGTSTTPVETVVSTPKLNEEFSFAAVPGSVDFQDMDGTIDPKVDFYHFANGTWVKNNPVPSTESRWSSFNILQDNNNRKLREILEKCAAKNNTKGDYHQIIGD
jgi:putative endopeptidase